MNLVNRAHAFDRVGAISEDANAVHAERPASSNLRPEGELADATQTQASQRESRAGRTSIRIAIVDDHTLSRESVWRVLAADPDVDVVGGSDSSSASELCREKRADILLVDSRIAGCLDICRELTNDGGRPWMILFAADGDEAWAVKALAAGARGILTRDACPAELAQAIHVVHDGQIWARRLVVTRMAEQLAAFTVADHDRRVLLTHRLSPREQEVLGHAVEGLSNKEIAYSLGTSQATVKAHLSHIFQKLNVRDRVQLAARYHDTPLPVSGRMVTSSSCWQREIGSSRS